MKKIKKSRLLKTLLCLLAGLLVILFLLLAFTQTRLFKNWLRDLLVTIVNKEMNGRLSIQQLEGNLISRIQFSGICLCDQQDTLAYLPRLIIDYAPLRILKKEIQIDSLIIESLTFNLEQLPDRRWNISQLIGEDSTVSATDSSEANRPLDWDIFLTKFQLRNTRINIATPDSLIPAQITDLQLRCSGSYQQEQLELHLREFSFRTQEPDFYLENASFNIMQNRNTITLQDFFVKTRYNHLTAAGRYLSTGSPVVEANILTPAMDFREFQVLLPDIIIHGRPEISLKTNYRQDSLAINLMVNDNQQALAIEANIINPLDYFRQSDFQDIRYRVTGKFNNINLDQWSGDTTLGIILNGQFHLQGKGLGASESKIELQADLSDSRIRKHPFSLIDLQAHYDHENLQAGLEAESQFGHLQIQADIEDLLDEMRYHLKLRTTHLNLGSLLEQENLMTDLNINFKAEGQGLDYQDLEGRIFFSAGSSRISDFPIDTLFARVEISQQNFLIDTLFLKSPTIHFQLSGLFNPYSDNNLYFQLEPGDLSALNQLLKTDTLNMNGTVSGRVQGKIDSLNITVNSDIRDIRYQQYKIESLQGIIALHGNENQFNGNANLQFSKIILPGIVIDRLSTQSDFTQQSANLSLDAQTEEILKIHLITHILHDSTFQLSIPDLLIKYKNQEWQGGSADMGIIWDKDSYQFQNFLLRSTPPDLSEVQELKAEGAISLAGKENFNLHISDLRLQDWGQTFNYPIPIEGRLSLDLQLQGESEQPEISSNVTILDGNFNQFQFQRITGEFRYQNERFHSDITLKPTVLDSLTLSASLPVKLSLSQPADTFFYPQKPLELKLNTNNLPLSLMGAVSPTFNEIRGELLCDVMVTGTLQQPKPEGFIRVQNGALQIPAYGIDFQTFYFNFLLSKGQISLEKFSATRDKGTLTATGNIDFSRNDQSLQLQNFQLDLTSNQFYLTRHQNHELLLDGYLQLSGNPQNPVLKGEVTIPRASFYLPAFTKESTDPELDEEVGLPRLVEEHRKKMILTEKIQESPVETVSTQIKIDSLKYLQDLEVEVKIKAPRNTWIKSQNMAIEIRYDLEIKKEGGEPEVFGKLEIVRGFINVLGRRFDFKESYVYFEGGSNLNPRLDIRIDYTFRTSDKEKKTLEIQVSDRVQSPQLFFTLDGVIIEKSEAMSYLIFGRSSSELSAGEQSDLNSTTNMVASYLSNRMGSMVGKKMGVDVLEVNSEDNWQSASVTVGKYISSDLYVSYAQRFGEDTEGDIVKQMITLEYEITRNILLQLVEGTSKYSGFDVIFKFTR